MYDMLGLAYYYQGKYFEAFAYFCLAVQAKPYEERLIENRQYAYNKIIELYTDYKA